MPTITLTKQRLAKYFQNLPANFNTNGYPYVFFPLTDYPTPTDASLFSDLAKLIINTVKFENIQVIVGQADRGGGPLVFAVAQKTKLPFTLANWYPRESLAQISVENAHNQFGSGFIYLNGIKSNQKVALVVDLISTGGSTLALANAVLKAGAKIESIIAGAENIDQEGTKIIERTIGIKPISIVKYKIINNLTQVVDS